jgi:hypothetical protein
LGLRPRRLWNAEAETLLMRDARALFLVALAGLQAGPMASAAHAGACRADVKVKIEMGPDQRCWSYRGAATTFIGAFAYGQRIAVQMSGEASDYDPRTGRTVIFRRPRDPNVEGPGGFYTGAAEAPGSLTFMAPASGTYRVSFAPCAMWGTQGVVKICVR